MIMKNLVSIGLLIGVIALVFTSCGKYEEGPSISLASKKGRVANEWIVEKQIVDGEDEELSGYEQYYIYALEKDGTGKMKVEAHTATYGGVDVPVAASETNLEWEFDDSKEQLRTRMENEDGTFDDWDEDDWSTIIKLKSNEMWLQDEYEIDTDGDGTDDKTIISEMHMKSK